MRGLYARAERALALLARGMQRESAASPLPSGVNGEIEDFVVHTHLAERPNYIKRTILWSLHNNHIDIRCECF